MRVVHFSTLLPLYPLALPVFESTCLCCHCELNCLSLCFFAWDAGRSVERGHWHPSIWLFPLCFREAIGIRGILPRFFLTLKVSHYLGTLGTRRVGWRKKQQSDALPREALLAKPSFCSTTFATVSKSA